MINFGGNIIANSNREQENRIKKLEESETVLEWKDNDEIEKKIIKINTSS